MSCEEWELTDICAASILAESQHGADSLGVSLLHEQLDDGLAIGLNQVLTLGSQRGGQQCAHILHSMDHFLLKQTNRSL